MQRFNVAVKDATKAGRVSADVDLQLDADVVVHTELKRPGNRTVVNVAVRRAGGSVFFGDASTTCTTRRCREWRAPLPGIWRAAIGASPRAGAPAPAQPPNYPAYDAYQRGRVLVDERSEPSLRRSLDYFDEAIKLDPVYAEPWAGKADAYIALGIPAFGSLPPLEARRLAKEALLKALELNPNLVEAHTSLAFAAYFQDWDWKIAEERFRKAIALNPTVRAGASLVRRLPDRDGTVLRGDERNRARAGSRTAVDHHQPGRRVAPVFSAPVRRGDRTSRRNAAHGCQLHDRAHAARPRAGRKGPLCGGARSPCEGGTLHVPRRESEFRGLRPGPLRGSSSRGRSPWRR